MNSKHELLKIVAFLHLNILSRILTKQLIRIFISLHVS